MMSLAATWQRWQHETRLPVLMKEMRSRMRGMRAPILLFTTGLAITVGLLIIGPEWDSLSDPSANGLQHMAMIGRNLFIGLIVLEAILCGLIAPSLTAGAVSLEREQQTLDLLLLTPLSSMNILWSKLCSSLSFAGMVLLCVLPITAISFLLGGVDPAQLCWAFLLILFTVLLFGCMGLYCSVKFPRTSSAASGAYLGVIVWLAITPLFIGLFAMFHELQSVSLHPAFGIFLGLFSVIFTLAPTALVAVICAKVYRRPLTWLPTVIIWLALAIAGAIFLITFREGLYQLISGGNGLPLFSLIGNPIAGLVYLFNGNDIGNSITQFPFVTHYFIPLTLAVELLGAWVVLVLAEGELDKLRR